MKLASLNHGRDGQLIIVSRDHQSAMFVHDIAPTLQFALDNWSLVENDLRHQYELLNSGKAEIVFKFNPLDCHSPLPRAFQWADGSAYVNHIELVRKARGAEMPPSFWTNPLVYQGMSDNFLPPNDNIEIVHPEWGWDFEAEVAVITDDVPMGISSENVEPHIKLIMIANDLSLRNLIPDELAKGFGFFQSKPTSSFSPIAVTPDELTHHWREGKLHLDMQVYLNGTIFGHPNAGVDMTFSFHQLISHVAKSRRLGAGTIIGSGTVSNKEQGRGSCCLAEKRMLEKVHTGTVTTPYLKAGDHVSITMMTPEGESVFGEIAHAFSGASTPSDPDDEEPHY